MREIPLTQGKIALVDDADYERLAAFKWCAVRYGDRWYAKRNIRCGGGKSTIFMHREILGFFRGDGLGTDHRNGNGLDNQRNNFRVATHSQNQANGKLRRDNHSGFKGVCWHKQHKKWRAGIRVNRKSIHLGLFDTPEAAFDAYRRAAEQHFGDFALHRRRVIEEHR